jgi:hypothetical protein
MLQSARLKPTVYSLVNVKVLNLLHRPQDIAIVSLQALTVTLLNCLTYYSTYDLITYT